MRLELAALASLGRGDLGNAPRRRRPSTISCAAWWRVGRSSARAERVSASATGSGKVIIIFAMGNSLRLADLSENDRKGRQPQAALGELPL
jgi:hypothetical protein